MGADIRRCPGPAIKRLNEILFFEHAIYRRQRSVELTCRVAVDKDMAYRLADKIRPPGGGLYRVTFMLKYLIPGNPGLMRLEIRPSAQFPGSDPGYFAGYPLGKALHDGFIYYINHGSFNLKFKMAA